MNQILVTEKLYITPELKRKKKMYKLNFFLSVFLVCILFSYYIYAEYDRNKNEEISKEILASIDLTGGDIQQEFDLEENDNTTVRMEDNVLIVVLNEQQSNREEIDISSLAKDVEEHIKNKEIEREIYTAPSGDTYTTDAIVSIPRLDINYPVLSKTTEELLKISLTKFWGREPNEVGNYVIVGHNYRNKKMFGKLSEIKIGDEIQLQDLTGRTLKYTVYDRKIVSPDDTSCTSQKTNGNKEVTLITCTNYGTQRLIIKAREVV